VVHRRFAHGRSLTCKSELLDLRDAVNHVLIMQLSFLFFAQCVASRKRFDAVNISVEMKSKKFPISLAPGDKFSLR